MAAQAQRCIEISRGFVQLISLAQKGDSVLSALAAIVDVEMKANADSSGKSSSGTSSSSSTFAFSAPSQAFHLSGFGDSSSLSNANSNSSANRRESHSPPGRTAGNSNADRMDDSDDFGSVPAPAPAATGNSSASAFASFTASSANANPNANDEPALPSLESSLALYEEYLQERDDIVQRVRRELEEIAKLEHGARRLASPRVAPALCLYSCVVCRSTCCSLRFDCRC